MKNFFRANYLELRYRTYYAVLYIPKHLQTYVGKTKFTKTTQTSDIKLAIARASSFVLDWKSELSIAGYQSQNGFIASALDLKHQLKNSKDAALSESIREVIAEEHQRYKEHSIDNIFDESFTAVATGKEKVLESLIPKWIVYLNNKGLKAKTIDQKGRDINYLTNFFITPSALNQKNVMEWIKHCAEEYNLSASTVTRIILTCNDFLHYLKTIEEVPSELVSPFKIPEEYKKTKKSRNSNAQTRNQTNSWLVFKPKDVENLYKIALAEERQALANLIAIAAYTGARIGEICALRNEDIELENDLFRIVEAKTYAGVREVPIHSMIKPLITHLMNNSKDGFLISGLSANKYSDRSNAIGKEFGRLKTRCGYPKLYVFHSIRKTAITFFENAQISESLAADIVGHNKPNITYGLYSGGNSITVKKQAIEVLKYDFQIHVN